MQNAEEDMSSSAFQVGAMISPRLLYDDKLKKKKMTCDVAGHH
jgi:hypothetical protein